MGATETRRLDEFPLFDWLRFAMASLVMLDHFGLVAWPQAGNFGVQLFFALSGWLIGTILIEMRQDKLPLFYFNRATRVWVPYFFAILLLYGISTLRDPINARWLEFLAYDLSFTHNWFSLLPDPASALREMPLTGSGNHFWSLAVEEQFYLAAPLIILFLPGGRSPWLWVGIALMQVAIDRNFGGISLGVAAAAMHHRVPGFQLRKPVVAAMAVLFAVTLPLLAVERAYPYAAPLFAIASVILLARPGARGPIGKFLGGMSYPLYLNHWLGRYVVNSAAKHVGIVSPVAIGLLSIPLGLAIGVATYLAIDRPVLARRMAWYTPARGRALAVTAYVLVGVGLVIGIALRVA